MTIIIGAITRKQGIIMSDSRIFHSAYLDNGAVKTKAIPREGEFDKTFSLLERKVIGAVAGLMEFSGKTVIEHIKEICENINSNFSALDEMTDILAEGIIHRMHRIQEDEVIFSERTMNIIIVGKQAFNSGGYCINTLDFKPDELNSSIVVSIDRGRSNDLAKNHLYKSIRGEENAVNAADQSLESELRRLRSNIPIDMPFPSILTNAIRIGIANAGIHKYGEVSSCSVPVFCKRFKNNVLLSERYFTH